ALCHQNGLVRTRAKGAGSLCSFTHYMTTRSTKKQKSAFKPFKPDSPAGNPGGKTFARFPKMLNPLLKSSVLGSSPGHQVYFLHIFQLLPSPRQDSNFRAHHR